MSHAHGKAEAAEGVAQKATEECRLARITAKELSPSFHIYGNGERPDTELLGPELHYPTPSVVSKRLLLIGSDSLFGLCLPNGLQEWSGITFTTKMLEGEKKERHYLNQHV